jgi:hypothetical protein
MDNRAVSPVVGKLLAAGLAVLYIASATGFLLGGVVPDYRDAAGDELAERVLATAAGEIEASLSATDGRVTVRSRLDLPRTIRGDTYRLVVANRTLRLVHPVDRLNASAPLALPPTVGVRDGTWNSTDPLSVRVSGPAGNRTLALAEGST